MIVSLLFDTINWLDGHSLCCSSALYPLEGLDAVGSYTYTPAAKELVDKYTQKPVSALAIYALPLVSSSISETSLVPVSLVLLVAMPCHRVVHVL